MDRRLTDFGKELDRPFDVHENCYDCSGFYDGCPAWPAAKEFACRIVTRLPDVMPGTCGQTFPPTSRKLPDDYWTRAGAHKADGENAKPAKRQPAPAKPHRESPAALRTLDGQRICACGAVISKRRRCCERCKAERRGESLHRRIDAAHRRARKAQEHTPGSPGAARTVNSTNDTPPLESAQLIDV